MTTGRRAVTASRMRGRIELHVRSGALKGHRKNDRGAGQPRSSGAAVGRSMRPENQNTACPLMTLGSHVEKNGRYVTMLIALKIAR